MTTARFDTCVQFDDEKDPNGSSFEFDLTTDKSLQLYAFGRVYQDRDNYPTRDEVAYTLIPAEVKALRDYLGWVIEQQELKTIKVTGVQEYIKPRVYKRIDSPEEIARGGINKKGWSVKRPWMCTATNEEPRETCYETHIDALHWATMNPEERAAQIEYDAQFEMGQ